MAISFDGFKQHRLSIVAAVLMATMFSLPLQSHAASPEQRCTELDANCLCSEPLQMTALNPVPPSWFDPNDSVTKQCNGESPNIGHGAAVITRNTSDLFVGSNSAVLGAFPAGHSVVRYLGTPEGYTGIFEFGHVLAAGDPVARVAFRWYLYHSPNFQFADKITCLNSSKWASISPGSIQADTAFGGNGPWLIYSWTGWKPTLDCCNYGPGWDPTAETSVALGKWYRIEFVIRNGTGSPGIILQAYRKNVTDNRPEYKIIDTSIPCVGCGTSGDWTVASGATTTLTPPGRLTRVEINGFRNGTCAGWRAYSHMLVAGWSTDAGQRIGAAVEIEGGGARPPSAPSGVTVR